MPTPTAWYSHAATTLQEERENSRMTADRPTPARVNADERLAAMSIDELMRLADQEVWALCSGKRKWSMTVPPEPTDSDLIFTEVLDRLRVAIEAQAAASHAGLRAALDEAELLRAPLRRLVSEYDEDESRPPSYVSIEYARAALAAKDSGSGDPDPTPADAGASRITAIEYSGHWRHAKWCQWERGEEEIDCTCGLHAFRSSLPAAADEAEAVPSDG